MDELFKTIENNNQKWRGWEKLVFFQFLHF
jgi:hypothetical protein